MTRVRTMPHLPERRRDFTGPREAASTWVRLTRLMPLRRKPAGVLFLVAAVALAGARNVGRVTRS